MQEMKLEHFTYRLGVVLVILKVITDSSSLINIPSSIDNIIKVLFIACMLWKMVNQHYSKKMFVFIVALGLLAFYICIKAKFWYWIFTYFLICGLQDIEIKEVISLAFWTKFIYIGIHFISYLVTYLIQPWNITYVYRNGVQRHTFFLGHANTVSFYITWMCLEWIYLHYDEIKNQHLVIIWLLNFMIYHFTDSNTGLMVTTIILLLIAREKYKEKYKGEEQSKLINFFSQYGFGMCSILFYMIMAGYRYFSGVLLGVFEALNDFFTGRLLYGVYTYTEYGMTWLGRSIAFAEKIHWNNYWIDGVIFDNTYIWLWVLYGAGGLVFLSISFWCIAKRVTVIEKILIIAFILYGIMEAYVINAAVCFPLLFIGKYLFEMQIEGEKGSAYEYSI